MVDSLRTLGGEFSDSQVWVFHPAQLRDLGWLQQGHGVRTIGVAIDEPYRAFPLGYKPFVAEIAEKMRPPEMDTFVWLDFASVFLRPPVLFALDPSVDITLRPVHIRNVGSPLSEPPDAYWSEIYRVAGLETPPTMCVDPFAEPGPIRPYFNCSQYSVSASLNLYGWWRDCFEALLRNERFRARACADQTHRIFLHQAIFSALVLKLIPWNRIRMLPPTYGYPLHLQKELAAVNRTKPATEVVSALTYGDMPHSGQPFFSNADDCFKRWLSDWLQRN